ncbi:MAG TPA: sporulation protein YabP [Clostridiales bacterium]|nr:sporulation protein YabP [Clostridiales bacterium]
MPEEKKSVKLPHNIIIEDRSRLMVTGVSNVDSFDEQTVVLITEKGELTIRGVNLNISKFNVETGELSMDGNIYALVYTNSQKQQGGLFSRLFR